LKKSYQLNLRLWRGVSLARWNGMSRLERFQKSCSCTVCPLGSGLFGFWLRFRSVTGHSGHAPSLKPCQKPKILAPHGHRIFENALIFFIVMIVAGQLKATEQRFDFDDMPTNQPPTNCFSTVAGLGKPGTWKVIQDEVPLPLPPVTPGAPNTMKKNVVAQLAWDTTDEHFPMLILGNEKYTDFTLKTRFKIADGLTEQMAGIAFRIQDEKNFYVARASALGKTFYFYKFDKGLRSPPIGNNVEITKGVWHELSIECKGTDIHIMLDGKEAMPMLHDPTFSTGKIGYWTKSDSISYFTDTKISYVSQEPFALQLVRDTMKEYPRLIGVQLYALKPSAKGTCILASSDEKEIGKAGGKDEADVIANGTPYFDKEREMVSVMMPLRDRNGDVEAAVRIKMTTFPGQTEENAFVRATPIIKAMQDRVVTVNNLTD
jgi:hypothetical protein